MKGIERIKILAAEVKDEALLEIINFLVSREDMDEKYLNEEKSLKQMIEFIKNEAKKKATNNMAMIKDKVVFSWAIHYFDESNAALKLDSNRTKNDDSTETEKVETSKAVSKVSKSSKKVSPEGQLCLFDMM